MPISSKDWHFDSLFCEASFVSEAFRKPGSHSGWFDHEWNQQWWWRSISNAAIDHFFIPYINFMPCSKFKRIFCPGDKLYKYTLYQFKQNWFVTKTIAGIGTLNKHNQRGNSKKKEWTDCFRVWFVHLYLEAISKNDPWPIIVNEG